LLLAGLSGLLAAVSFVTTVLVGGLIVPGYSHLADSVSSLTSPGAPYRSGLAVGFVIYNVAVFALGIALPRVTAHRSHALNVAGMLLMACGIAGVLMIEPFPQDAVESTITMAGAVHIVLALVSAAALVVATFLTASGFHGDAVFGGLRAVSIAAGVTIAVTGAIGSAAVMLASSVFGGIERLTQFAFLAWFAAIGVTSLIGLLRVRR